MLRIVRNRSYQFQPPSRCKYLEFLQFLLLFPFHGLIAEYLLKRGEMEKVVDWMTSENQVSSSSRFPVLFD